MTGLRRESVRIVLLVFVAAMLPAVLGGCPATPHLTTRLYAEQAYHGYFVPTDDASVYDLVLWDVVPDAVWFTDRPDRDAGLLSWATLAGLVWNLAFDGQEAAGGIGYRLDDGVWELIPAQFLDASFSLQRGTATWRVRLLGVPPRSLLTGVTVYIDDKTADETEEADTGVYLYAAAQASFEATDTEGRYLLTLAEGLDEVMLVRTPPALGASLERTDLFVEHTWPAYFADDPPNAVVTIEGPGGAQTPVVVVLSEPAWNAETATLTFLADVLLGDANTEGGPATVFIDDWDDEEDMTIYRVVVNHEEQYSIWPADRELPLGWNDAGFQGTKQECLDYIEQVWTDMRPLSLRKKMQEAGLSR